MWLNRVLVLFFGIIWTEVVALPLSDTISVQVCRGDTLVLSQQIRQATDAIWYYQWAQRTPEGKWEILPSAHSATLLIPDYHSPTLFRCKTAKTMFCLDDSLCTTFTTFFRPELNPPPQYDLSVRHVTCDEANGSIDLDIYSDKERISSHWKYSQQTEDLYHLTAGTYYLWLKDDKGCTLQDSVIVKAMSHKPKLTVSVENAHCSPTSGEIRLRTKASHSITWENGSHDSILTKLSAGTYRVQIQSDEGCRLDTNFTISRIDNPISIYPEIRHASCNEPNGSIRLNIRGQNAPFEVNWRNGAQGNRIENLAKGHYLAVITDKYGCELPMDSIEIVEIPAPQLRIITTQPTCKGTATGKLTTNLANRAGYGFVWSTGSSMQNLEQMPADRYEVWVTDSLNQCTLHAETELKDPKGFDVKADIGYLGETYQLQLTVNGGEPPYVFNMEDSIFQDQPVFSDLYAGSYDLYIIDNTGCVQKEKLQIGEGNTELKEHPRPHPPIFAPNLLTPNGDNRSDAFVIHSPNLNDAHIEIFNKEGKLIFEDELSNSQWRGSSQGAMCPEGVYYFSAKLVYANGEWYETKGSIRLVR